MGSVYQWRWSSRKGGFLGSSYHNGHSSYTLQRMKGSIGIDEVGRGPLAGPITVCACYVEDASTLITDLFQGIIRDSKKIKKSLRFNIYQTIRQQRYFKTKIQYCISSRDAQYIDRYGISKATQACVTSCIRGLAKKGVDISKMPIRLDAGLTIKGIEVLQESFIKGDENFVEIALASIMAKESRDAHMQRLSRRNKEYGWEHNVGYGTKFHRERILEVGVTTHHRKSYLKGFKLFDKAE
jgi:ribonuclease HII